MYALMALVFVTGYLCIALEHPLKIDKAASALLTAVIGWTVLVMGAEAIIPAIELAAHGGGDPATSSARNFATTSVKFPKSSSSCSAR